MVLERSNSAQLVRVGGELLTMIALHIHTKFIPNIPGPALHLKGEGATHLQHTGIVYW